MNANTNKTRTKELVEGINGRGEPCYIVVTVALEGATIRRGGKSVPVPTGYQIASEYFAYKPEALNWIKWA